MPAFAVGVVLTAGLVGGRSGANGASAGSPLLGAVHAVLAAVCYSGFLFLLRRGGRHGSGIQTYAFVLFVAAGVSLVAGLVWHGFDLTPGWRAVGWLALAAILGGVVGWLLVALSSPRLPSHVGAVLLLLTPVGAMILGALVLGERPSPAQLVGAVVILVSAGWATSQRDEGERKASPER